MAIEDEDGRFIWFNSDMIFSDAYQRLTGSARTVLMAMLFREPTGKEGFGVGAEFNFGPADCKSLISPSAFRASLKNLEKNGFIEIVKKGQFHNRKGTYRILDHWNNITKDIKTAS